MPRLSASCRQTLGAALTTLASLFPGPSRTAAEASAILAPSSSLPISIRNEVDVAVENGRLHLEAAQLPSGLWPLGDSATSLPAFAFLGSAGDATGSPPRVLRLAVEAAFARLAATAPFAASPTSTTTLAEDALVASAAVTLYGAESFPAIASAGDGTLRAVRDRLLRADAARQTSATAWLGRCALELLPGRAESPADWAPLFRKTAGSAAEPTLRDAAIAGYARLRHGTGADTPAAILAHLRWLRAHEPLLAAGDAPAPSHAFGDPSPEDLYYLALFLDSAPPALVSAAGIIPRWRARLAQRLIAAARSDGHSGAFWQDASGDTLRPTLYAVAALAALGQ